MSELSDGNVAEAIKNLLPSTLVIYCFPPGNSNPTDPVNQARCGVDRSAGRSEASGRVCRSGCRGAGKARGSMAIVHQSIIRLGFLPLGRGCPRTAGERTVVGGLTRVLDHGSLPFWLASQPMRCLSCSGSRFAV